MKISFIVVALNAGGCLGLLLDDLRAQTLPPEQIELLLVDSASQDNTLEVMRAFAASAPFDVKILHNPKKWLASGINVALREATQPTLAPGHHWAVTASVGSSIGMKGMIRIGKVMAIGTYEVMTHPDMVAAAKEEFQKATGGKPYDCPVTDDIPWPYKD